MRSKGPEAQLQKAIIQWLRCKGAAVIRINSGGTTATYKGRSRFIQFNDTPGCSDILACANGRFVAIEVKRDKGKVTELQESFLQSVKERGGIAFVARSLADVERELDWL